MLEARLFLGTSVKSVNCPQSPFFLCSSPLVLWLSLDLVSSALLSFILPVGIRQSHSEADMLTPQRRLSAPWLPMLFTRGQVGFGREQKIPQLQTLLVTATRSPANLTLSPTARPCLKEKKCAQEEVGVRGRDYRPVRSQVPHL